VAEPHLNPPDYITAPFRFETSVVDLDEHPAFRVFARKWSAIVEKIDAKLNLKNQGSHEWYVIRRNFKRAKT
jgi:hypothetical protein